MEVFYMRVYVLDEENELDLEMKVNEILANYDTEDVFDIKYSVAVTYDEREQIYCFSCMIIYDDNIELNNSKLGSM